MEIDKNNIKFTFDEAYCLSFLFYIYDKFNDNSKVSQIGSEIVDITRNNAHKHIHRLNRELSYVPSEDSKRDYLRELGHNFIEILNHEGTIDGIDEAISNFIDTFNGSNYSELVDTQGKDLSKTRDYLLDTAIQISSEITVHKFETPG